MTAYRTGLRGFSSTRYQKNEWATLADLLENAEDDFAELLAQKTNKNMQREKTAAEGALAAAKARNQKVLGLFEKLYEDNVEGKVTDE